MRNPRILLYIALVLAALNALRTVDPPQQLPLVHADYQDCVKANPGPIERPDHYSAHPYGARKKDIA